MKKAQIPLDEEVRLAELSAYRILDTPSEKEFDELAQLLKHVTQCEGVAISFIDRDRQWFKSGIGLPATEVPKDITMCSHTILDKEVMVVRDTHLDDRFFDNPFVTTGLMIRFYAGAPIITNNGHNIGTVCVFDNTAHDFSQEQSRAIEIISAQVTKLLELRMKNRIIMDKAEEIISIERKSLQLTLREQEEERKSIGGELHENFAQVLAACMMYLNMAVENKTLQRNFIDKSREELGTLLQEIRRLSRTYNPISVQTMSLEEIIRDFITEFHTGNHLRMKLDWKGNFRSISPEVALNLFRIVVQYVQLLAKREDVLNAVIRVNVGADLLLSIHSDGNPDLVDLAEQKIAINAILTRVDLYDGSYDLKLTNGNTVFRVTLPLIHQHPTPLA